MIEASRRGFLVGALALVAAPAIVRAGSLMPVNSKLVPGNPYLEMLYRDARTFVEDLPPFEPGEPVRIDVLYGKFAMRPGDIVTWGPVEPERDLRQFVVTATDGKVSQVMEDARRMYSFNNEAERKRFGADWQEDYKFVAGEQWGKAWFNESDGLSLLHPVTRVYEAGFIPQIPDSLALAAAAVAIAPVVLAKPVTRRFWGK